ncbi:hypothetical protein bwei_5853 [Bacillus mycoides]|nr:hypothetical protein bwei_5853 [Bacillus mycoides]
MNLPKPLTTLTFLPLAIPAKPPVNWLITFSFQVLILSMSVFGSPKTIPCSAKALASSITLATCNKALDGIQPTFKQTPPKVLYLSTITVSKPKSAHLKAAE